MHEVSLCYAKCNNQIYIFMENPNTAHIQSKLLIARRGGACLWSQHSWGRGGRISEFQDSQGYTEKPCLELHPPPKKKLPKIVQCIENRMTTAFARRREEMDMHLASDEERKRVRNLFYNDGNVLSVIGMWRWNGWNSCIVHVSLIIVRSQWTQWPMGEKSPYMIFLFQCSS